MKRRLSDYIRQDTACANLYSLFRHTFGCLLVFMLWCNANANVTPPTRVRTNSPNGSRTGAGGGRSNKERQRLQPLTSVANFEVRGVRFTHSPYWHTSVTLTPLNLTPVRVTAPM